MTPSNTDTGDTGVEGAAAANASTSDMVLDVAAVAPRDTLITTAVNFLQNAKVRHTTLLQKQQFLRSKGLTSEEIQLACERAGVFSKDPNNATVINMGLNAHQHSHHMAMPPMQQQQQQLTPFGRFKEILHSMALISGVAYAIYMFWKKFVEPFLFARKKKSIDESLKDIDRKVDERLEDVNRELTSIKEALTQQQRDQSQQFSREFNLFRADLDAIKGLLLNRKQFALPLGTGPASIPAWQLSASSPHRHHHLHSQSDDNEKADDAGSGSGSSETEVVTKNSDSSLEIM